MGKSTDALMRLEAQLLFRFLELARIHEKLEPLEYSGLVDKFKLVRQLVPPTPESDAFPGSPASLISFIPPAEGVIALLVWAPDGRLALRSDFVGGCLACIKLADNWEEASSHFNATGTAFDEKSWRWHCFELQIELLGACILAAVVSINDFEPGAKCLPLAPWFKASVSELATIESCPAVEAVCGPVFAVDWTEITEWFESNRSLKRPRGGRGRIPYLFKPRNRFIVTCLQAWKDCGLPMHQHSSLSSMDGTGYQIQNNNDGTWTVLDEIGGDVRGTYDSEADAKSALRGLAENECPPNSIIAACAEAFEMKYKAVEKVWDARARHGNLPLRIR